VLACSLEFKEVKIRSKEMQQQLDLIKRDDATKELIPKPVGKLGEILNMPALCIILAYMLRMNELNEHL